MTWTDYSVVQLEKMKFYAQQYVQEHLAVDAGLEIVTEHALNALCYRLTAEIFADKLPPEKITRTTNMSVEVPATWWQHWKEDHKDKWYGRWIYERYGVDTRTIVEEYELTVDLKRWQTYPEAKIPVDYGYGRAYNNYQIAVFDKGVRLDDYL